MVEPINQFIDLIKKNEDTNLTKLKESLLRILGEANNEVINFKKWKIQVMCQDVPAVFAKLSKSGKVIFLDHWQSNLDELENIPHVTSTPCKSYSEPKSSEDFDVTGSPLKCSFLVLNESSCCNDSILESKNESKRHFIGFSFDDARKLCYDLKCILDEIDLTNSPYLIMVACSCSHDQNTSFLGLSSEENKTSFIKVEVGGPFTIKHDFPSIDHFISTIRFSNHSNKFNCNTEALYDVLIPEPGKGSSMSLRAFWKRPLSILSPPDVDASTQLVMQVCPSDHRSPLFKLYSEIELLKSFIDGLSMGEMNWLDTQYNLETALTELFENIQDERMNDPEACGLDAMIKNDFNPIRNNGDFTDLVWATLKYCDSYKNLTSGLQSIFEAISSTTIRPRFLFRSKTQVEVLSRQLMSGQSRIPKLEGETPLSMLIEIGIEKLRRDYINIFQVGALATLDTFSKFVQGEGDLSSQVDYRTYLSEIEKMHIALQVAVHMKVYLQLPQPVLIQSLSQVLADLLKEDFPLQFEFSLQTSLVDKLYQRLSPKDWKLTLTNNEIEESPQMQIWLSKDAQSIFASSLAKEYKDEEEEQQIFATTILVVPRLL